MAFDRVVSRSRSAILCLSAPWRGSKAIFGSSVLCHTRLRSILPRPRNSILLKHASGLFAKTSAWGHVETSRCIVSSRPRHFHVKSIEVSTREGPSSFVQIALWIIGSRSWIVSTPKIKLCL
jgi:hypothetical protein